MRKEHASNKIPDLRERVVSSLLRENSAVSAASQKYLQDLAVAFLARLKDIEDSNRSGS